MYSAGVVTGYDMVKNIFLYQCYGTAALASRPSSQYELERKMLWRTFESYYYRGVRRPPARSSPPVTDRVGTTTAETYEEREDARKALKVTTDAREYRRPIANIDEGRNRRPTLSWECHQLPQR